MLALLLASEQEIWSWLCDIKHLGFILNTAQAPERQKEKKHRMLQVSVPQYQPFRFISFYIFINIFVLH